jgi:protein-S-isoprenylcysteine O-methyltransferase Ste14
MSMADITSPPLPDRPESPANPHAEPSAAEPSAAPAAEGSRVGPKAFDRLLDGGERLMVLALYAWLVRRMILGYMARGDAIDLLVLPSEGIVVVFLLLRRGAREISKRPGDWLLATLATCAPLLIAPAETGPLVPVTLAASVFLMGLFVQVHAKINLGRSFGCVAANRGVKRSGPYQFVRHPMYAGYLLSHVAFLSLNPSLRNLALYTIGFGFQIPRLLAEERLLGLDPAYREYQQAVRYRLIPGLF